MHWNAQGHSFCKQSDLGGNKAIDYKNSSFTDILLKVFHLFPKRFLLKSCPSLTLLVSLDHGVTEPEGGGHTAIPRPSFGTTWSASLSWSPSSPFLLAAGALQDIVCVR